MYQVSDMLLKHKKSLEDFLFTREQSLFEFRETITLYDLTNTYLRVMVYIMTWLSMVIPRKRDLIVLWLLLGLYWMAVVFLNAVRYLKAM